MVQKIFAFFLIQVFFIYSAGANFSSLSSSENIDKQVILEKGKLEKIKNWVNYRKKIDTFIEKVNNADKLLSVQKKIDTKLEKMYINFEETSDAYIILNYLSLKIEKQIQFLEEQEITALLKNINNSSFSKEEKGKVENELLKVQKLLLSAQKDILSIVQKELDANLEQKWNLSMSIEASSETMGGLEWALQLKNISSKKAGFDTALQTEISALIKASIEWQEAVNMQFSSFLDFIWKDGNFYLLLEKLNYSWIEQEKVVTLLENIKESALKKEYIQFTDDYYAQTKKFSQYLNYNKINTDVEKLLSTSLFTPYKKVWDKYYLIPTMQACKNLAGIQNTFYAYTNIDCSESQYKKFLKSFIKNWDLYITLWNDSSTLGYTMPVWEIKIVYNDTMIKTASVDIEEKWNILKINYIKGYSFDVNYIDSYSNISFKSVLAKDNSFSSINYTWTISGDTSKLTYKNWKIDGSFTLTEGTWKINWKITGTIVNKTLTAATLKISDEGIEELDLLIDYSLNNGKIIWKVTIDAEKKSMVVINTIWTYSKDNLDVKNSLELWFLEDMLQSFNPENSLEANPPKWNINLVIKKESEVDVFNLWIDFIYKWNLLIFRLNSDLITIPFSWEIKAPIKYINIQEITPSNNNYDY